MSSEANHSIKLIFIETECVQPEYTILIKQNKLIVDTWF